MLMNCITCGRYKVAKGHHCTPTDRPRDEIIREWQEMEDIAAETERFGRELDLARARRAERKEPTMRSVWNCITTVFEAVTLMFAATGDRDRDPDEIQKRGG